jgi:hypothetical protein
MDDPISEQGFLFPSPIMLLVCPRHGTCLPSPIMDENPVSVTGKCFHYWWRKDIGEFQPAARRTGAPCPPPTPPPPTLPSQLTSPQSLLALFGTPSCWFFCNLLADGDIRILPQSTSWHWYQNSSSGISWHWYQNSSAVFTLKLISEFFLSHLPDTNIIILP